MLAFGFYPDRSDVAAGASSVKSMAMAMVDTDDLVHAHAATFADGFAETHGIRVSAEEPFADGHTEHPG
jgi:hypothetical protein